MKRMGVLALLVAWTVFIQPAQAQCIEALLDGDRVAEECADDSAVWSKFEARFSGLIEEQNYEALVDTVLAAYLVVSSDDDPAMAEAKRRFSRRLLLITAPLLGSIEDRGRALLTSNVGGLQLDPIKAQIFAGTPDSIVFFTTRAGTSSLSEEDGVHLALLARSLYQVFGDALATERTFTLAAVRRARARWTGYLDDVSTRQLPWEVALNALCGPTGSIESPPNWQFAFLHPSVAVEIGPESLEGARLDELTGRMAVGVELIGFQRYSYRADRAAMTWGLSAYVSRVEDTGDLGLGPLLRMGGVGDIAVVFRNFEFDQWGVALDLDLLGQLGSMLGATKGLIAGGNLSVLNELEAGLGAD